MSCVYCGWHDGHTDSCPMVTGVFPILDGEFPHGLRCMVCSDVINDVYIARPHDTEWEDLICLPCDVLDRHTTP